MVLALGPHFHSNSPGCRVIQSNFIPGELIQSSIYSGKTFQYGILPGKLIQSNSYSEENLSNPAFIPEKKLFKTTYFPGKTNPAQCLFGGKLIQSSIFSGKTFQYSIIAGSLSNPAFIRRKNFQYNIYSRENLSNPSFTLEKLFNTALHQGAYPVHHLYWRKNCSIQQLFRGKLIQSSIYSGETFQYSIIAGKLIQSSIYSVEKTLKTRFIPVKTYPTQHLYQRNFLIQHYSRGA